MVERKGQQCIWQSILVNVRRKCQANNQEDISCGGYLVIDHYGEAGFKIHNFWASKLIAVGSTGKTISFHAQVGGVNDWNVAVLKPYFLRVNQ